MTRNNSIHPSLKTTTYTGMKQRRGFTLIELLTVMAIVGVLAAVSWPGLAAIKKTADLKDSVDQFVSVLRQAQAQAIAGQGIAYQEVKFTGPNPCAISSPTLGTITAPVGITCTTQPTVQFERLTGKVLNGFGTIVINTKTITISPAGVITGS